jgi:hypothetical protein
MGIARILGQRVRCLFRYSLKYYAGGRVATGRKKGHVPVPGAAERDGRLVSSLPGKSKYIQIQERSQTKMTP